MSGFPNLLPISFINSNPNTSPIAIAGAASQSADLFQVWLGPGFVNKIFDIGASGNITFFGGSFSLVGGGAFMAFDNSANTAFGEAGGSAAFFADSAAGDMCLRGTGTMRLGVGSAHSLIQIGTTSLGFGALTTGIGNGTSTSLSALAKGTGTGPASDVVNAWMPVSLNGTAGWLPFFT